ncbi:MAG: acyltransferase [Sphingobium sp.]
MVIGNAVLHPRANNITLVRLILACCVIWSHCYWLMTGEAGHDEFSYLLGAPISGYAVDGFFFLSGFLSYSSLQRSPDPFAFIRKKLVRIWPALAVSIVVTIALGALLTNVRATDYIGGATLRFGLANLTFLPGHYTLTGVACGMAACGINDSLWTISWQMGCFGALGVLALLGLAREKMMKQYVLPLSLAFALAMHLPFAATSVKKLLGINALDFLSMIDRHWTMFALGIASYLWRGSIQLRWSICALLLIFNLECQYWDVHFHVQSVFVGYAILCAGFLTAERKAFAASLPNISFGIYLYAFPVMILIAHWGNFGHHLWLALANLVLTAPFAVLSYQFIEKRAPIWNRSGS